MSLACTVQQPRWAALGMALVAAAAIGVALISQHRYDLQPCPWCVLQRLVFALMAVVALVQAMRPTFVGTLGIAVLAACGVAAALWQHFVAAASASCNLTWADRFMAATQLDAWMPDVFQPRASCMDAKAWILGVPYEFYAIALFAGLAVWAWMARPINDGRTAAAPAQHASAADGDALRLP